MSLECLEWFSGLRNSIIMYLDASWPWKQTTSHCKTSRRKMSHKPHVVSNVCCLEYRIYGINICIQTWQWDTICWCTKWFTDPWWGDPWNGYISIWNDQRIPVLTWPSPCCDWIRFHTTLKKIILTGWPSSHDKWSPEIQDYFTNRDELSIYNGVILKGLCVIITESMNRKSCNLSMKENKVSKNAAFVLEPQWCGINKDFDDMIRKCIACQHSQKSEQKEPLIYMEAEEEHGKSLVPISFSGKERITL